MGFPNGRKFAKKISKSFILLHIQGHQRNDQAAPGWPSEIVFCPEKIAFGLLLCLLRFKIVKLNSYVHFYKEKWLKFQV